MQTNFSQDVTVSGVAYTGALMPSGIFNDDFNEVPMIIDLETLQVTESMPVLDDHGFRYQHLRDSVIGLVDEIFVEDGQLHLGNATIFTGDEDNEAAHTIINQMAKDIPYQLSIRWDDGEVFRADKGDVVNGIKLNNGDIVVKNAKLVETTITLFGRDDQTSVTIN